MEEKTYLKVNTSEADAIIIELESHDIEVERFGSIRDIIIDDMIENSIGAYLCNEIGYDVILDTELELYILKNKSKLIKKINEQPMKDGSAVKRIDDLLRFNSVYIPKGSLK